MSFLLDLIILLIAGLTIFFAVKNGFIKTFLSAASALIALVIVFLFTSPLAGALETTSVGDAVHSSTASFLDELVDVRSADGSYTLEEDPDGKLSALLDSVGIDRTAISKWISERTGLQREQLRKELIDYIADRATSLLLRALSIAILFFGSFLVLKLASILLTGIVEKIPFVREANRALGLVLGILLALVHVFVFCAVVRVLLNTASFAGWSVLAGLDPEKTFLFRLIGSIPFLLLS